MLDDLTLEQFMEWTALYETEARERQQQEIDARAKQPYRPPSARKRKR